MGLFLVLLGWFSVLIFVVAAAYKIVRLAAQPLHLRWELYPVAHEPNHYGGSYMEEVDYASKPRHTVLLNELKELLAEVFYLKRVREYNRFGIWPFALAMHWGIYFFFFWLFLLLIEEVFDLYFTSFSLFANIFGVGSFFLGALGALGLIIKRAGSAGLKLYTTPVDYFNLFFLLSIFGTALLSWINDPRLIFPRVYIDGVLFLQAPDVPLPVLLNFLLFELFLIYMPFTKLLHYAAKFFTFHKVLWDDGLNTKGSPIDKKITAQLAYRVTWAAPHIVPGKTWAEQVQIADGREVQNE
ncbi:MAG: hypothetical protein AB1556_07055 [Bacillota bacterium]